MKKAIEKLEQTIIEMRKRISLLESLKDEQIRRQNAFLNQIIESLPHPFYVIDARDFTVKPANAAASPGGLSRDLLCIDTQEHRSVFNTRPCMPPPDYQADAKTHTVEHLHYRDNGDVRYMEIHAFPVFDGDGEVEQIIEYALDVTERKRMEEELLENAERIKLFAYTISRDIRNPLIGGVHGLTQLLAGQYGYLLDDKGRKYCEQVLKTSEKAVSLVEDIYNFVKSKELPLHCEIQRRDDSNKIEGTGLGLAIVKEIAAKHKGKAWAERGRNGGASFCVSISKFVC